MKNTAKLKPMLKTIDVARLLNVHINTIRRWSKLGILRAYKVSTRGDLRFKHEDVFNSLLGR
ncbi:helix-turn-helix domain-containing protein [Chloroflexota bacterium]